MSFLLLKDSARTVTLKRIATFLEVLPQNKTWQVIVQPFKRERSLAQNAYLYGVAYKALSDTTGYELDEIAEYMCGTRFGWKRKRCPKTPENAQGWKSVPVRTTTRNEQGKRDVLKRPEFSDYVAFVQRFAAEKLGLVIPDPDPNYWTQPQRKVA